MDNRVGIIGAGISGLLAGKYAISKGFWPIIFEEQDGVGGVWSHTIESTKLQNSKDEYYFSDFPWPSNVTDICPHNTVVLEYLQAYAQHFNLLPHIKFNSRVVSVDYVGESYEEMESWEMWGGAGKAFGSKGKWNIKVQHIQEKIIQDYTVEFLVLCIGRFSGLPNIPEFLPNHGPEIFGGKVLHTTDFSEMDNVVAAQLIKGKNVAVIGSEKFALDVAAECANSNGVEYPCTLVVRTPHWMLASPFFWGVHLGRFFLTRFTELMVHKPGEGFLHSALAFLLSPLRRGMNKFAESYVRWKQPIKKYNIVPPHSILQDMTSCKILVLPENFYDKVKEGSIVIRRSRSSLGFCKEGLILDGERSESVKADLVILATGCKGDQKLKNIFASTTFQDYIFGSPTSTIPLYRQIIHPRIPQLAVIGYAESNNNMHTLEMKCWWLSNFLAQAFDLPRIKEMEKDVLRWEKYMKRYTGDGFRRSSIAVVNIWYNDHLCKDAKINPRRKKGFFSELFETYGTSDYSEVLALKN